MSFNPNEKDRTREEIFNYHCMCPGCAGTIISQDTLREYVWGFHNAVRHYENYYSVMAINLTVYGDKILEV